MTCMLQQVAATMTRTLQPRPGLPVPGYHAPYDIPSRLRFRRSTRRVKFTSIAFSDARSRDGTGAKERPACQPMANTGFQRNATACLLGGLREPTDQNLGVVVSNEVRTPTCNVDLGREHIGSGCKRRDKTSVADRIGDEEGTPDGDAGTLHGGRQAKAHVSQDDATDRLRIWDRVDRRPAAAQRSVRLHNGVRRGRR